MTLNDLKTEAARSGRSLESVIAEFVNTHLDTDREMVMAVLAEAANERYGDLLDRLADL